VPDLREVLAHAENEDLVELLDALDIQIRYDKPARTLEVSALLSSDLISPEAKRPPDGRSQDSSYSGGGS